MRVRCPAVPWPRVTAPCGSTSTRRPAVGRPAGPAPRNGADDEAERGRMAPAAPSLTRRLGVWASYWGGLVGHGQGRSRSSRQHSRRMRRSRAGRRSPSALPARQAEREMEGVWWTGQRYGLADELPRVWPASALVCFRAWSRADAGGRGLGGRADAWVAACSGGARAGMR